MRLVVVAVGLRLPAWADQAFDDYAKRFPPEARLELRAIKAEPRGARPAAQLMAAEGARIESTLAALSPSARGVRRIALDEHGSASTSAALADRWRAWQRDGRDAAFLIGGPDGLDAALKSRCDETLRLSDLTLPHAFVRVLLAEALYRAWSIDAGHPYHRE